MWSDSNHSVACYSEGFIDVTPSLVYFSAGTVFRNCMRITQPSPDRTLLTMSDAADGELTLHVFDEELLRIPNGFRLPSGFGIQLPTLTLTLDLGWSMCLCIDSGTLPSCPRGIRTRSASNTVVLLGESTFYCDTVGLTQDGRTCLGSNTWYAASTKPGVLLQNVKALTVGALMPLPSSNLRVNGTITYYALLKSDSSSRFDSLSQDQSVMWLSPFVRYSKEMAIKGHSYSGGQVYILSNKVYFSEGIQCVENIELDEALGILRFSPSTTSTVKISAFGTSLTWEKGARLPAGFTLMRGALDLDVGWAKTVVVSRKLSNPFVAPAKCSLGTAQWKCSQIQLHEDGTLEFGHDGMVVIEHKEKTHYLLGKLRVNAGADVGMIDTQLHLLLFSRECSEAQPVEPEDVGLDVGANVGANVGVNVTLEDTRETSSLLRRRTIRA